jgi:hypothetical protein
MNRQRSQSRIRNYFYPGPEPHILMRLRNTALLSISRGGGGCCRKNTETYLAIFPTLLAKPIFYIGFGCILLNMRNYIILNMRNYIILNMRNYTLKLILTYVDSHLVVFRTQVRTDSSI